MVAAFYPLAFVAERVAGEGAEVTNLTPAGGEPHDLELTARDVVALREAGLVLYLGGFAPALDDAVADLAPERVFDVAGAARLVPGAIDGEHADEHGHADSHGDAGHADEALDPHFWLDPTRLADVATALAERLAADDPAGADDYAARAADLAAELEALDGEYTAGLADCDVLSLVTSHAAFGYLADRYGFEQRGIAGLSPDAEPTPGRLAEVTDFVTDQGVSAIYFETLVDPAVAETVAAETGAVTAVLDPLEGLTEASAGDDYFAVMRANLATLRAGQRCR